MPPAEDRNENESAEVLFLTVRKQWAERTRRTLAEHGLLDFRVRIRSDDAAIHIPLVEHVRENDVRAILEKGREGKPISGRPLSFSSKEAVITGRSPIRFRDVVKVPPHLQRCLPSSWDVVGGIILVKLTDELVEYGAEIARALLEVHSNIESVYRVLRIGGERRVRELEHLGGLDNTLTVAREHGIRLHVDVARMYYSPRLATERWRVACKVLPGERIIDMFAGVGPFSFVIARHASPSEVHAVDINPDAIGLLEKNIEKNRVGNVTAHPGDARDICPVLARTGRFHRIIMNLPHSSTDFLPEALFCCSEGTVIHLYIIDERERMDRIIAGCIERAAGMGYRISEMERIEVRGYSPSEANVCSDILVERIDKKKRGGGSKRPPR